VLLGIVQHQTKGKQEMTRKRPGKARECPIGAQNNGKE